MNKNEKDFHKSCKVYEDKINLLIKNGNDKEVAKVIRQIEEAILQWEEVRKVAKWRATKLRALLIKINSLGGK